jgi:methionyl-tRNA formyltransferase
VTLRIVFFGTDDIALPSFHALVNSLEHQVCALVSQPDRPAGRGRKLTSPRIVDAARKAGIEVIQKENLKENITRQKINSYGQDINIVFAYGCYIPSIIYDAPEYRSINIHPSMLPCHRGANPIRAALACGDEITGVSIQYVEKVMDTGDILSSREVRINPDEIFEELAGRLSMLASELLLETLRRLAAGEISPGAQDESKATICCKWEKSDTIIDWNMPGRDIHNRVRAFSTSPGAQTMFRGKIVKILRTSFQATCPVSDETFGPGTIVEVGKRDFIVTAGAGSIIVCEVKPEAKPAMDACSFINGFRPKVGERLG